MGRQLPWDTFVVRKLAKWDERAAKCRCSFVDAIGVDPLEEMIFLWNGYKRMDSTQLQDSLDSLAWSETSPHWAQMDLDEHAILALLRASILRNLRRHEESKEILRKAILNRSAADFKGNKYYDDWPAPMAQHEYAVNLWMQRTAYCKVHGTGFDGVADDQSGPIDLAHDAKLVSEARTYLEKAKNWEKYELDARLGIKITAGLGAVTKWEESNKKAPK
jgi:hypothetical protein